MIFTSNSQEFVQSTSLPGSFELKLFSHPDIVIIIVHLHV